MVLQMDQFRALFGDPGSQPGGCYLTDLERRVLVALARHVRARTVVEFGVQDGKTAKCLMDSCPSIREYVGIDLPAGGSPTLAAQAAEVPRVAGEAALGRDGFRLLLRDSRDLSAADLPAADLVFVDGGHDYDTVAHDTAVAEAIVRPGAIVWHDYNAIPEIGVRRLIDELNGRGDRRFLVPPTWLVFQFAD